MRRPPGAASIIERTDRVKAFGLGPVFLSPAG